MYTLYEKWIILLSCPCSETPFGVVEGEDGKLMIYGLFYLSTLHYCANRCIHDSFETSTVKYSAGWMSGTA